MQTPAAYLIHHVSKIVISAPPLTSASYAGSLIFCELVSSVLEACAFSNLGGSLCFPFLLYVLLKCQKTFPVFDGQTKLMLRLDPSQLLAGYPDALGFFNQVAKFAHRFSL